MNVLMIVPRVISKVPSRNGVGTYFEGVKALLESKNATVDFISEDVPKEDADFFKYHSGEYFEIESVESIRKKLVHQLFQKVYEVIVCSSYEGILASVSLGIHNIIPVYYRPHNCDLVFKDRVEDFPVRMRMLYGTMRSEPNLRVLAQCEHVAKLSSDKLLSPTQIAYNGIEGLRSAVEKFVANPPKQNGVLYIARYAEDAKRVHEFVSVAKHLNTRIKIMTASPTAAKRWVKLLEENGIHDHDVRYGLSGEAKFDFIASAKVAVSFAAYETFGNAVIESLPFSHFVIHQQENDWHRNFEEFDFYASIRVVSDEEKLVSVISKLLKTKNRTCSLSVVDEYEAAVARSWSKLLRDTSKYPDLGRVGGSELSKLLDSNATVDWSEFASDRMFRKLRQVYCYKYNFGLKTKGPLIKGMK